MKDTGVTRVARMQHECDTSHTSETRVTRVTRVRQKCDMSGTRTIRVRHECYTKDTNAAQLKNFGFDNETSKNIFLHPYIYYMASERLQGEE